MIRRVLPSVIALALVVMPVVTPVQAAETRSATPGVTAPRAALADLAWMEGTWEGRGLGDRAIESYTAPAGGRIVGHFVSMNGDKVRFTELVQIEEAEGSLLVKIKHFNADMTGWEEKDEMVRFPLVAVEKDAWYFDHLTFRRLGADGMAATVKIRNPDGTSREERFEYRRVR